MDKHTVRGYLKKVLVEEGNVGDVTVNNSSFS